MAGIAVMVPVVTLLGFIFITQTAGRVGLEEASRSALLALPTIAVYLGMIYVLLRAGSAPWIALMASATAWLGLALLETFALAKH